jgi:hypothetical protein
MRDWVSVPFALAPARPGVTAPPALAAFLTELPREKAVFVALPTYNGWLKAQALRGLILAAAGVRFTYELGFGSLLTTNFNRLLCMARNTRPACPWTHFAMHHADVSADPGWLDTLVAEMDRVGADVLSAVIAIKDDRRLTSTGTVCADGSVRRLALKEVYRLPETFSAQDLPRLGIRAPLVVNTGLFVCDFTKSWADEFVFRQADDVVRLPDGTFRPLNLPEDWGFSGWCNQRGLRVFATRKVPVVHWNGDTPWDNGPHEDGWDTDLGDDPGKYDEVRAARALEAVPGGA